MSEGRIDRLAAELRRRRLSAPAIVLLEAHRPIAPLLADAAAFAAPILSAMGGAGVARAARELFTRPDGPDRLVARLAAERDDTPGDVACRTPED